jgi:Putative MetA-pathway of phenol degradation
MRSRTSLVLSATPLSVPKRSMLFPQARRLGILSAALLCLATPVRAQDDKLAGLLLDLLSESGRNSTSPNPNPPANNPNATIPHAMHFIPGLSLQLTPRELNKAIGLGLTTFPLPSSAGGFAYTTDPATGEIRLATTTFGPVYAERAFTIGKKRFDFGVAFQPTSFDSFETAELSDGSMQFILEHNNCCPANNSAPTLPTSAEPDPFDPAFERDLLRSQISVDIEAHTTVFFANYGVTERFDVGAAIPIVSVDMAGRVTSTILRTATAAQPGIHTFAAGQDSFTVAERRSATGLGDVLLRAKYNFVRSGGNALAAAIDFRLPTGDEDDLLGTGATQTRLQLLASGEYALFAPHVSFGYTFSNGEVSDLTADVANTVGSDVPGRFDVPPPNFDPSVPDEVNYTFGFSAAAHPRVTLGFDFIGRTIRDVYRFDIRDRTLENRGPGVDGQDQLASFTSTDELIVRGDPDVGTRQNLNLLLGVVGGKVNIGRGVLLNGGVLFPLSNSGLQPNVTPYFSFEYVF